MKAIQQYFHVVLFVFNLTILQNKIHDFFRQF